MKNYLSFEEPIAAVDRKIEEVRYGTENNVDFLADHIEELKQERIQCIEHIYNTLTPWQITQISRHPDRPHLGYYLQHITSIFEELHGDRMFADDPAIVGGLAQWGAYSIVLIGHRKGLSMKDKVHCNFGMPRPEGYRKALRLMFLAEKFQLPIVTLIDTPGAYPGIEAEARNQSEAIGKNIYKMIGLSVPTISIVIGEGGSGGALALAAADSVLMLEYSTYSVISPEGCSIILWKSADQAAKAADQLGITAKRLLQLGLIDGIIPEPLGGAHNDKELMAKRLKEHVIYQLDALMSMSREKLLQNRYDKIVIFGNYQGVS